jgi:hypothetical protein
MLFETLLIYLSQVASYLFPKAEGPRFVKGYAVVIGLQSLLSILTGLMWAHNAYQNKKKDAADAARGRDLSDAELQEYEHLAENAPAFRYTC